MLNKQLCDIDPQDSSWALNIAKKKRQKDLGEKLPPRISIDSHHIGDISKSLEPTPSDILKSIRSVTSQISSPKISFKTLLIHNVKSFKHTKRSKHPRLTCHGVCTTTLPSSSSEN
uniref:Uncharacterized protein n=1 Tax=Lactuca sativa TaxID=4236 RepID=A0A9R1VDP0_LACSA|nr:hypothetical protein LSAT_V11C500281080 [Lactuca sativa]